MGLFILLHDELIVEVKFHYFRFIISTLFCVWR
jgi:hypothetical protein